MTTNEQTQTRRWSWLLPWRVNAVTALVNLAAAVLFLLTGHRAIAVFVFGLAASYALLALLGTVRPRS